MIRDEEISPQANQAYQRRRLTDAARFLPALGLFLFILPVLAAAGDDEVMTASGLVFVFSIWGMLIVASALLSRWLGNGDGEDEGNRNG